MTDTTVSVNQSQKQNLIQFRSKLESETGHDISQGEAVSIAAELASDHVVDCIALNGEVPSNE